MGIKPVKSVIQVNSMDEDLRKSLWNDFMLHVWSRWTTPNVRQLGIDIWIYCFKNLIDEVPRGGIGGIDVQIIKEEYFKLEWNEVYDLLEFVINHIYEYVVPEFVEACNNSLKRNLSAYRFIGKRLIPVTSEKEVEAVEEALVVSTAYTQHLKRAVDLLADRNSPDYPNSIKESISAVEAICQLITGSQKATLGDALRQLDSNLGGMHPALRNAFNQLYGYTSDAQGIRHALLGASNLDADDAKFMLIACSAFINYLVAKADKAGIKLPPG